MEHILIPKEIASNEPCIRCVMPSKMKKERIKDEAMLPRVSMNDVSVLRENYTTLDFCIEHGKSIDSQTHKLGALLRFTQQVVDDVNEWAQTKASEVENLETHEKAISGMKAHLEYSPMIDGDNYADKSQNYYTDSPILLPMHADLIFEEPLEKGLVRTRMRKFGNELIKRSQKAIMEGDSLGEWKDDR